ncbi:hypothetical protein CBL_08539 [Carabus blaptoides fortunei]
MVDGPPKKKNRKKICTIWCKNKRKYVAKLKMRGRRSKPKTIKNRDVLKSQKERLSELNKNELGLSALAPMNDEPIERVENSNSVNNSIRKTREITKNDNYEYSTQGQRCNAERNATPTVTPTPIRNTFEVLTEADDYNETGTEQECSQTKEKPPTPIIITGKTQYHS